MVVVGKDAMSSENGGGVGWGGGYGRRRRWRRRTGEGISSRMTKKI